MDNYNPLPVEKKWQDFFEKKKYLKLQLIKIKNFTV